MQRMSEHLHFTFHTTLLCSPLPPRHTHGPGIIGIQPRRSSQTRNVQRPCQKPSIRPAQEGQSRLWSLSESSRRNEWFKNGPFGIMEIGLVSGHIFYSGL